MNEQRFREKLTALIHGSASHSRRALIAENQRLLSKGESDSMEFGK